MTDMHTAALMADHFDKIQKLPNPIEGVPNFRCVPGYQVTLKLNLFIYITRTSLYDVLRIEDIMRILFLLKFMTE